MTTHTELFGALPGSRFTDDPVLLLPARTPLDGRLDAGRRELAEDFEDLADDRWLKGDHVFRKRRFGLFAADTESRAIEPLEDRAFFQSTELNPYAGGMHRKFEPLAARTRANPYLAQLMWDVLAVLPGGRGRTWEVGVHLMRIVARPGLPGHPAPEGMHHDGHAFTSITLVGRADVSGGVSRFAGLDGRIHRELALERPGDTVVFEDPRCLHDVTPVEVAGDAALATRDVCGFSLNPVEPNPVEEDR
ncbi:2OG-Fe dioxygenase family protein [Streptomyces roseirectus]|uniref:2OG-Fe dioxygenase family protein n=1 Tax=Streptomyces roseirectus TaxID=2768066 RepID=A0A7H0I5P6_9ACTN|nr:2OG-Fe dioxygenase family protein [Streptomyces roseirectus]QNP68112.1 2OG-Fe dioxygenase family protein [Streptomyces roseirectus]